jgi:SAM-dependent methyltransferase
LDYAIPRLELGNLLDYGCGSGVFIAEINKIKQGIAFGYEPFMTERCQDGLPIYSEYNEILKYAPYQTITIFEVMEHLQWTELANILVRCSEVLHPNGVIIVSVPIEIGPVILIKEINRFRETKQWNYNIFEFLGALIFGIAGWRKNPDWVFMEHKGFDFRELLRFIRSKGWITKILGYGPLPIKFWYGNSQIFFMVKKLK